MASGLSKHTWSACVNAKIHRPVPRDPEAGQVAAMFGLRGDEVETLYEGQAVQVSPGQIVVVAGPSGAGKSVLLREVARQVRRVHWLRTSGLARSGKPAVAVLDGGSLAERLQVLSRCGLAEASALITAAKHLSGGQLYRLALAKALYAASRTGRRELVIADEFASCLDDETAAILARQVRKFISRSPLGLLVATPRLRIIPLLGPDQVVYKPLRQAARTTGRLAGGRGRPDPRRWPIMTGTIHDYRALSCFHYLAGPPAAHKRVYVIRRPRSAWRWAERMHSGDPPAAVLVVSPPLLSVRGRNIATDGRYAGPDRRAAIDLLNEEVECISRVVVHPTYRGCGLADRLVRHALANADTPMVEALAVMGRVHPFLERAGMRAFHIPPDEHVARLLSAAEAVGLSGADLAAVGPVKRLLTRRQSRAGAFLRDELDRCAERTLTRAWKRQSVDPVAEVCRRAVRHYVYYLAQKVED